MSHKPNDGLKIRTNIVDHAAKGNLNIPAPEKLVISLVARIKGSWNPWGPPEKCMICWKPLDIEGKDARSYMECRHCKRKAHQSHMLRWLAKKDYCPYCRGKW